MKLRPIIFSGPMVRAILDGRKTQTRRIVTLREFDRSGTPGYDWTFRDREARWHDFRDADFLARKCPFGAVGDGLWVRETWGAGTRPDPNTGWRDGIEYKADCRGLQEGDDLPLHRVEVPDDVDLDSLLGSWRSPILMPRWASRLTLVVRSVRVERLSAITDADAIAEGARELWLQEGAPGAWWQVGDGPHGRTPREAYLSGFRAMHKLAADADPWLWVVGFERMEAAL